MGCGASKVDDFQLVTLCRERKEFIKAASHHRYALAAAHISYFHSLREVGDALRKFIDEEIVVAAVASSSPASPVLTLPSDQGKRRTPKPHAKDKKSSPSASISHSASISPRNSQEDQIEGSHLHFSSGSESDSDLGSSSGHIHLEDSPEEQKGPTPPPYSSSHSPPFWGPPMTNVHTYYMRRSPTPAKTMVYDAQERYFAPNGQWTDSSFGHQGYSQYQNTGFYGMPMGMHSNDYHQYNQQPSSPAPPPAPPSPPSVSAWDYINVFDGYDYGYPGYYPKSKYGYGSTVSSPDSIEVRKREGIPDLEDETEQEKLKATYTEKKVNLDTKNKYKNSGEGTSKAVPPQSYGGNSKTVPLQTSDSSTSAQRKEIHSSPDTIESRSSVDELVRKKAVSFEVGEGSALDVESSKMSSLTTLTSRGTRDLQEVVKEIRDEFEVASSYGKEVALLLEAGKLPYQSKTTILKVIFSRIMYLIVPSMLYSHPPPGTRIQLDTRTVKLAKQYSTSADHGNDFVIKSGNLSLTLEKLYAWEKKLYKEVKDEEKLRLMYEKKCKRLKTLDDRGADSSKIDATQITIRKLLTKINVCISAVDAISGRIHKLRDEELQPQLTELIHGLIKMWKSIFKCHQKQFQAIMDSKIRALKARTAFRGDLSIKATLELELELRNWYNCFKSWISSQKCYAEAMNEWLLRCISHEPEETSDGIAPFSPGRIGAPPIFITCNDWYQAMETISEERVGKVMREFASNLEHLWERQGEEQRQRIKAEFMSKDFEKLRMERGRMKEEQERVSADSKAASESGVSALDDLKVDLDSMRKRLEEERERHKDAMRLVDSAASSSIQVGLVPIFEALEKFSSQAVKAHEQVRLANQW